MTDSEYAVRIYCEVFHVEADGGDAHIKGILDTIETLDEREQTALENYYRRMKTFEQTGTVIGVSRSRASQIVSKALRKLRHPSRLRNMSVAKIAEHKNKLLEEEAAMIAELRNRIVGLSQGAPIEPKIKAAPEEHKEDICELNLSSRAYNCLIRAGLSTIELLLALDSFYELMKIRGLGEKSQAEIIGKMRDRGYAEWAERMENRAAFS